MNYAAPINEYRNTAKPLFFQPETGTGHATDKRQPITRGPYASKAARKVKVPTLREINTRIDGNRDEFFRLAEENCRRLTGQNSF